MARRRSPLYSLRDAGFAFFLCLLGLIIAGLPVHVSGHAAHQPERHATGLLKQERTRVARHVPSSDRQIQGLSETSILSLIDGEADTVNSYHIDLPLPLTLDDVEFSQTSSNHDVYDPKNNENVLISTSADGKSLNVTISNFFDGLVGKTTYEFLGTLKSNGTIIYSTKIDYTIVGISFYRRTSGGEISRISGPQGVYEIPYQNAMNSKDTEQYVIYVLVQYADGSTSADVPSGPFPKQESLTMSLSTFRGQLEHDESTCDMSRMGSFSTGSGLTLPAGCGYGFYRNEAGDILFGLHYAAYRSGLIVFDISWPALVESVPSLAEDGYSEKLDILVTGVPPIIITSIQPQDTLFRKEGGQALYVKFYNAYLRPSLIREFVVENATGPFQEVGNSYRDLGAPTYLEEAEYTTTAGYGQDLSFSLDYYKLEGAKETLREQAILVDRVAFRFSYDTVDLRIDSISPEVALESGGDTVVLTGYFNGFDPRYDGIYFNGKKVDVVYKSISATRIEFILPNRSDVGDGYEFEVQIRVGYARSSSISFMYVVGFAEVRITQSGTTQIAGENVYRLGDCTPGLMTAVVTPFTSQIESYQWSLVAETPGSETVELLPSLQNPSVNRSRQTIQIQPGHLLVGQSYILSIKVTMRGTVARTSVTIVRENAVVIGAYILKPPVRSIAYPEAPLRLSAVVDIPGECYNGTQGLMFEWTGFGRTQRYSPKDATGTPLESEDVEPSPARLGREFIVPQSSLSVGDHEIVFKTWMEQSPFVAGSARAIVQIKHAPLQAIIRRGESRVYVNGNTDLEITGKYSRDPDVAEDSGVLSQTSMSYEWTCLQTTSTDFSDQATVSTCDAGFLPAGTQPAEFMVSKESFAAVAGELAALKYGLVVKKDGRVSEPAALVVDIVSSKGTEAFFTEYTMEIQDGDGNPQDIQNVKYYKAFVLNVQTLSEEVSWTYQIVEPKLNTLLDSSNLIQTPAYYSPDEVSISGNRKPLGISALGLEPSTKYTVKVSFSGSETHDNTDVWMTFWTSQAPALSFPEPTIMNGTTRTQFVATAGIPGDDSEMSYYFILRDSDDKEFCVGGCIGHSVAYFRIGRPGNYTLSVMLFDSQGQALLASQTLSRPIVVSAPAVDHNIFQELFVLFANGDDSAWTQLAYDLAIQMETNASLTVPAGTLGVLADGLRKIMCDSRPSTGHSQLAIDVATQLSRLGGITQEIFYDLAGTTDCTISNMPEGTRITFSAQEMLDNLQKYVEAERSQFTGTGRRRLLQVPTAAPFNLRADVIDFSSRTIVASVLLSKLVGYVAKTSEYTVALVTSNIQLPTLRINGARQYGLDTEDASMKFYVKDRCVDGTFPVRDRVRSTKRFMSLRKVPNFVDEDLFQSGPPPGTYLADKMMLLQIFEQDENGKLRELELRVGESSSPCYCSEMPIVRNTATLNNELGAVPTAFTLTDYKPFGVAANQTGEYFNYDLDESVTMSYSVATNNSRSWAEVCTRSVGFMGPTISSGNAQSAQAFGAQLIGVGGVGLVGMVLAGLLVTVIAVVASWMIATRSMADGAAPAAAVDAHEMYVERDIYGRETIFGKSPAQAPAAQ